ncbi:UDP-2,3-diacylglucosamine diphosphatase [Ectothiorhodospiraceae bacterium BW-2]|nr:UDP-2,3-diacylglucosamine diphosphatase [Ectothiorhodospiraceae bacterium BW-2]
MRRAFIADLHLSPDNGRRRALFSDFLAYATTEFTQLYILGDLFDIWLGDDIELERFRDEIEALAAASAAGLALWYLPGNRDFLIGESFYRQSGCQPLPEPTTIQCGRYPTLLLHGDTLCSDDSDYQQLRQQLRQQPWRDDFLAKSATERQSIATTLRQQSDTDKRQKSAAIMDVSPDTVVTIATEWQVSRIIHGHTHRPGVNLHQLHQQALLQRFVVDEWQDSSAGYLSEREGHFEFHRFAHTTSSTTATHR